MGLNLYYFYLLRRPAEDIPSHAYLHKGPEPVGEVEDPDLVGEDGEIRIEDVVIGYNDDDDQHQERPPVPLKPALTLRLGHDDVRARFGYGLFELGVA